MNRLFSVLAITFILITPGQSQATREIPDDNLAFPVLITLDTGVTGSGFFVNTGTKIHLVTAKHVLFDETSGSLRTKKAELLSYSRDPKEIEKNVIQLDLSVLLSENRIQRHSTEDVATVHIADVAGTTESGPKKLGILSGGKRKEGQVYFVSN